MPDVVIGIAVVQAPDIERIQGRDHINIGNRVLPKRVQRVIGDLIQRMAVSVGGLELEPPVHAVGGRNYDTVVVGVAHVLGLPDDAEFAIRNCRPKATEARRTKCIQGRISQFFMLAVISDKEPVNSSV